MDLKRWRAFLLSGLIFWFGLQIIRVFFPSVMWYLSRTMGEIQLALFALITFALTLTAPLIGRWLGQRVSLGVMMAGVTAVRFVLQFTIDAQSTLVLSTLGLAMFTVFLPLWLQSERNRADPSGVPVAAVSFPLALLFDTASRTVLWSYDLVWRTSWWAPLIAAVLAGTALWLLIGELQANRQIVHYREPSFGQVIPLAGLGAWLYLSLGTILNPQALIGFTGWEDRIAHLIVVAVSAFGTVLCVWIAALDTPSPRGWMLGPAAGALIGAVLLYIRFAPAGLWFIVMSISLWAALGWILRSTVQGEQLRPGLLRTALAVFLAFLVMLVCVFLNEFNYRWITPTAAGFVGLLSVFAARQARPINLLQAPFERRTIIRVTGIAVRVAIAAVVVWLVANQPIVTEPVHDPSQPVRVMTYNIHQGLNADIYMDLESIINVIEAQNPDIVGLNEVNRARANNGYNDTLALLSRRLRLPYVYGANFADGQYGNAILSRYPIVQSSNLYYATNTTEVRGLLRAVVEIGGQNLVIYSTHLDHTGGPNNARRAQIEEALQQIEDTYTVFMGDLNAPPEAAEIQPLYEAGLVDVLEAGGLDEAFTFWSEARQRIDYIFITNDLRSGSTAVIEDRASDHLPVITQIYFP